MDAAARADVVDWIPQPHEGSPAFDHAGLEPLETFLTSAQRPMFLTIFGAVAALVFLGCVNISGLMASRADERWREFATRRALGASTSRLARLPISESLVTSAAGIILGLFLVRPMLLTTWRLLPPSMGLLKAPGIDRRVLAFAIGASLLVALAGSVWPIRRSASLRALPFNGAGHTFAPGGMRGRLIVVATQIALGFVLALGGTLLVGSLVRVWRTDPGFDADHLVVAEGTVQKAARSDARAVALAAVRGEIGRIPGVQVVGGTESPILRGGFLMNAFAEGSTYAVDSGFFQAAGLTLVGGRWLSEDEITRGAPVVVVSEKLAKRLTSGSDVVGRTIPGYVHRMRTLFTIVGTVKDARFARWDEDLGQAYAPYSLVADDQPIISLLIRTRSNPAAVAAALMRYANAGQGAVQISAVAMATDLLDDSIRDRRLSAWIFGGFAFAALVVMAIGVLGVLTMSVARRTREVGIRLALGATRPQIVGGLLIEQLIPVLTGLAAGGVLSFWTVRLVRTYLYQTTVFDSRLWLTAGALVAFTAFAAILFPSLRATRIDPIQTLRAE